MPCLGFFWARILEKYCYIWNQDLRICLIAKSDEETKILKFRTKNALFGYFWPKIPYLDIFGLEFFLLPYLKSAPLNLSNGKYREIMKISKFGTKRALFGYFWARILKSYCHIWNQHPRIYLIAKFRGKTKIPKFGTKSALYGCFWARIF